MPSAAPLHRSVAVKKRDTYRASAARRGYGYRWRKYTQAYKRKHPLCRECLAEGLLTPAVHVDHIQAVSGPEDRLFWLSSNHQPLCHSHHSRKTVREDRGFGRHG